ncbi:MAG: hypothetical protein IH941_10775 [Acidobacteria bacterium]|nr:hypothetical protein [Acidobacteriota bacterium]
MISAKRTLASVLVAMLLVATAIAAMWLMASAGVFGGAEQPLAGAPESSTESNLSAAAGAGSVEIKSGFQVSQPRDPFEPLIVSGGGPTTTLDDESTTTTTGDGSTTTTTGDGSTTTTTGDGSTTTTTAGDSPDGIRVVLLEVRDESGSLVAVVEVDGETYTVGVGDTFAVSFKVVSLTESGGVFTFGDSAFTLAVGQSILK